MNLLGKKYSDDILPRNATTSVAKKYAIENLVKLTKYYKLKLDKAFFDCLNEHIAIATYEKDEIIFAPGQEYQHINYVLSGVVLISDFHNQNEMPFHTHNEGNFAAWIYGFLDNVPTLHQAKSIKKTIVAQLSPNSVIHMFTHPKHGPSFIKFVSTIHQELEAFLVKKSLMSKMSADKKLAFIEAEFRELYHNTPNKVLASIIGIQPETLSRLKKGGDL